MGFNPPCRLRRSPRLDGAQVGVVGAVGGACTTFISCASPGLHRRLLVNVSSNPEGRLTDEQLSTSLRMLDHIKQRHEAIVNIISGHEWIHTEAGLTFGSAYDTISKATAPTYTENTHTFRLGGSRFYIQDTDMMEYLVNMFARGSESAFDYTEDVLVGSDGSHSSPHLDNAPCNPNRVTVLVGKKLVAAWPFDPVTKLPPGMPVSHVTGSDSPPMTLEAFNLIGKWAEEHGGWVKEVGPGGQHAVGYAAVYWCYWS